MQMTDELVGVDALVAAVADACHVYPRQYITRYVEAEDGRRFVFVTVTSGGPVVEGGEIPAFYASEHHATEAWWQEFLKYKQVHPGGTMLWRQMPEMVRVKLRDQYDNVLELCYVRARLVFVPAGTWLVEQR